MTWLAAYQKEHDKFPREQRIKLSPRLAYWTTIEMAKAFDLKVIRVDMTNISSGHAGSHYITLPYKGCSLGMVLHELAHIYNRQKYDGHGHTGSFVNALSIMYHHSRPIQAKVILRAKAIVDKERHDQMVANARMVERQTKEAERRQTEKSVKSSRAFKIAHLKERIKRLESKSKRINTLIKTARRSLSILERYQRTEIQKQAPRTESVRELSTTETKEAIQ